MAYGMVVYDENGDIQFNTEDPALYFDSNQVTETNFSLLNNVSMSSGTGSTYRPVSYTHLTLPTTPYV